jgi:hypothetical protein
LGLALILPAFFAHAEAANVCPGLSVANASGSPPVVQGIKVDVAVDVQPSAVVFVFLDNTLAFTTYNPGTKVALIIYSLPDVPYGSHTLYASTSSCIVDFSNTPAPAATGPSTSAALVKPGA